MSMTENEYKHLRYLVFSQEPYDHKEEQAIIKIFEEIQQYRAIGTVEGYKRAIEISKENFRVGMEYKAKVQEFEAIGTAEELKSMKKNGAFSGVELAQIASMQMKLKEYQSIGTIDEFKALKESEKQGLLLRLPCPIGSEVWKIHEHSGGGRVPNWYEIYKVVFALDLFFDFGKTVFHTKEEAERALANKQDN